jgi:purine-nucleoside phosphorylase
MALVPEVILARRFGLRVLALAMVTNLATGLRAENLSREKMTRIGNASASALTRVLMKFFEIWVVENRIARNA